MDGALRLLLARLQKGDASAVGEWNEVRRARATEDTVLVGFDFSGVNARGLDLSSADLSSCRFNGAVLLETNFFASRVSGCDFSSADISGSNFMIASMDHAILVDVTAVGCGFTDTGLASSTIERSNFAGASLDSAYLDDSTIRGCVFREAYFGGCQMPGCSFERTDLTGARFHGRDYHGTLYACNLRDAQFLECDLSGADFSGATFAGTRILSDISVAAGLTETEHLAPSYISLFHLEHAQRPIPKEFLRSIGLTDTTVEFAWSLASTPFEFYSCFISYADREPDSRFARTLYKELQARGIRCWLDKHELKPGDNIRREIDTGIKLWDKTIFCASRNSLSSWWAKDELTRALAKEQQLHKERGREVTAIIPIDLDGFLFRDECDSEFRATLCARFVARIDGWEDDEGVVKAQLEGIVTALRCDSMARAKPPAGKL